MSPFVVAVAEASHSERERQLADARLCSEGGLPDKSENCYRLSPSGVRRNMTKITKMRTIPNAMAALAVLMTISEASAADPMSAKDYEVVTQSAIVFAEHDGTKLLGDLYLPKGRAKPPVLVAIHGGGWQLGDRIFYQYWGPFLARRGYAVFAIDYRLGKPGAYPAAVYDCKAAIQFVRAKGADYGVDPERIGLIGDSAGAHLSSLLALAGDQFTAAYSGDPHAATPADVKAVVGFYGVYDMLAQWNHDLAVRPRDMIVEKFLGTAPTQNRRTYFEASPLSYATADRNKVRFLLIHGTDDDIVDSTTQSGAFLTALMQAQFFVRRIVILGAGHFWANEPFESDPSNYNATVAPQLLRFLDGSF
jgi:acetyl esterase/lipase